jgi:hypothetical protein
MVIKARSDLQELEKPLLAQKFDQHFRRRWIVEIFIEIASLRFH